MQMRLVTQGNFRWQNPFPACKIPAFSRSFIDCINLWYPKSSSPQKSVQDNKIIYSTIWHYWDLSDSGKIS